MNIVIADTKSVNEIVNEFYTTDGTISNEELSKITVIVIYDDCIHFNYFDKTIDVKSFEIVKVRCRIDNNGTHVNIKFGNLNDSLKLQVLHEIDINK